MVSIVLEGCDACFKTTVANKLSAKLGYPVRKGSSFELSECSNEELFDHFAELAKVKGEIIDRNIYSNYVYATLYQDYTILEDSQRKFIEGIMRENGQVVVYLHAPEEVIIERLNSRGDDYVKDNMIGKIINTYDKVINEETADLILDTSEYSSDDIVEEIIELISYRGAIK